MATSNHTDNTNGVFSGAKLLWKHPSPASTPMTKFLRYVNYTHDLHLSTYKGLHEWSIQNIDAFWGAVWNFVGVRAEGSPTPVSSINPLRRR